MKRISYYLLMMIMIIITFNTYAYSTKPGFIVTPFSRSVSLAANSTVNVFIIAQNNTGVNQTITNIVPNIPTDSEIIGTVTVTNCGFQTPGSSCDSIIKLQSGSKPAAGNMNISICAFNGAFCSQILRPIDFTTNAKPLAIFISPTNPTIVAGTTKQFFAIALFSNFTIQNITTSAVWNASDITKATISNAAGSQGLATGVASGSSTITASLDGVSGSTTLTVSAPTLTSITVTPTNPSVANGFTRQFTAVGIYSDNSHQDLTSQVAWSSSNTAVATVSNASGENGLVTTKSIGSSNIIATFGLVSGSSTLTVTPAILTSISVTPSNPSTSIFTTEQFTATGIYSDNSFKDLTSEVTWSTESTLIAIISNQLDTKGKATGVGVGTTNVIATFSNIIGTTTLRITPAVLVAIDVTPINISIPAGFEQLYTATGIYNNGRTQDLTTTVIWLSSNPNIATISNAPGFQGLAHAIQAGSVSISATSEGINDSTGLTVENPILVSITVTPASQTIANGTQLQFTATGNYSDASTQNLTDQVTWISSNPSIAVISNATGSRGLAKAIAVGSTTITAAYNSVTGNTPLTVSAATLSSIAITPANSTIPTDTVEQLTATGTYSDLSTKVITNEVTWLSSDTSIATISNALSTKGVVSGIDNGSVTISAILSGITGTTPFTVINAKIGDPLQGGIIACLDGGLNNLIAANADNSNALVWGGNGNTTSAQSSVNGASNTTRIVSTLGAGTTYAAGLCSAYEIDSAGNAPCVVGNTCYNDWFLPATNQLLCLSNNKNKVGGFSKTSYWGSTEDSTQSSTKAFSLSFAKNNENPVASNKTSGFPVRCVRVINATLDT